MSSRAIGLVDHSGRPAAHCGYHLVGVRRRRWRAAGAFSMVSLGRVLNRRRADAD